MMMPSIEPYFVRSVRTALPALDGPLFTATTAYLQQEGQHHRQHVLFNEVLSSNYSGLAPLDRFMRSTYRRLEDQRSQRFNLAFAASSETMAYSAARWAADHRQELFADADDVASTLFLWHLAEEVEHKSVAFDVYWSLFSEQRWARVQYLAAMLVALALVVGFVVAGTAVMLASERRIHHPLAWIRLIRWSIGFAFELLTNLALSAMPSHHPSDFVDPTWYEVWLREFDAETETLPVWSTPLEKPLVRSTGT